MKADALFYLVMRLANAVLTVAWGFGVTSILVRAIGIQELSRYVLIGAFGVYLVNADLGVSDLVYAYLRKAFFAGDVEKMKPSVLTAIGLYFTATAAMILVYLTVTPFILPPGKTGNLAPFLFFLNASVYLPWVMLRGVSNALNAHIRFETIDLLKRAAQLGALATLLLHTPIIWVYGAIDAVWIAAFLLVLTHLTKLMDCRLRDIFLLNRGGLKAFGVTFGGGVRYSLTFAAAESGLYLFPYVFIPAVYGAGPTLVIFDLFYKFFRAAMTGNQIASSGLLPELTRAYHAGNRANLARVVAAVLGLSLLGMTAMALALTFGGHIIFGILLHGSYQVPGAVVAAIIIVAMANAIQNTGGSFIVGIGQVRLAQGLAIAMLALMLGAAGIIALTHAPFPDFMLTYAWLYMLGALSWGFYAWKIMQAAAPVKPQGAEIPA